MKHLSTLFKDDNLRTLHGFKKVQHILAYYKFALVILCIALYFIGYSVYGYLTHKDALLYAALVNVVAGEDLTKRLGESFTESLGADPAHSETVLYTGLYLTDDEQNVYHEYTYASRMKILAAIEGKMMDVVLMNQEAFDAFSQNGYLCDLDTLLKENDPALYERLKAELTENIVILSDNAADCALDPSIPYTSVTEAGFFGLNMAGTELIRKAGFEETVYLGVVANSPRTDTVLLYLRYLTKASG